MLFLKRGYHFLNRGLLARGCEVSCLSLNGKLMPYRVANGKRMPLNSSDLTLLQHKMLTHLSSAQRKASEHSVFEHEETHSESHCSQKVTRQKGAHLVPGGKNEKPKLSGKKKSTAFPALQADTTRYP